MKSVSKTIEHRGVELRIDISFILPRELKGSYSGMIKPGKATFAVTVIAVNTNDSNHRKEKIITELSKVAHTCYFDDIKNRAEEFEKAVIESIDSLLNKDADSPQHEELFELGYK